MGGDGVLKLQKIYFENYRGIKELGLDLDGKSTVLYGVNGSGKSSVLKGISLIFSQIITKIVSNQFKQQVSFTSDDVRYGSSASMILGSFLFDNGQGLPYSTRYSKEAGSRWVNRKESAEFTHLFTSLYLDDANVLPVFALYGVNRAVLDIPVRIRRKHEFGRLETYQNAIGTKTDFRTFFEWFRNQEDTENARKVELQDLAYRDPILEATRKAIYSMLPELSNIRIKRSPIRMCATKNGQTLSMEQFSDGEKCVLAMLGDLARRLALANPHVDDPLLCGGIVLIDEIELHMHPSWQRNIVPTLHRTFPNVQFIITTHSPLVLGELTPDFKIFSLAMEGNALRAFEMPAGYYDANLVLEDRMGTPSIAPVISSLEGQVFDAIMSRDFEQATAHLDQLSELTHGTHPSITKAQILIRRTKKEGSDEV